MPEGKYIVFKREQFYELMGELGLPPWSDGKGPQVGGELDCAVLSSIIQERAEAVSLDDAVVIRRKDIFAPPALDTYANSITVALQLTSPDDPQVQGLTEIADYFHEQAAQSWNADRKIPD